MKNKKNLYILAGLIVAFIVVAVLFGLTFKKNNNGGVTNVTPTESTAPSVEVTDNGNSAVPGSDGVAIQVNADGVQTIVGSNTVQTKEVGSVIAVSQYFGNPKSAKYTVSNPAVASVDAEGNVTALAYGKTEISASYEDENGKTVTETKTVEVLPPETNSSIGTEFLRVDKEEEVKIPLTLTDALGTDLLPLASVEWSSSDEEIATVDQNGVVTPLQNGLAIINVTIDYGNERIGYGFPVQIDFLEEEEIEYKHTHYFEIASNDGATCEKAGTIVFACECGEEKTENSGALGHDYKLTETIDATCGKEGHFTYTCSRCKDSYETAIPKLEHVFVVDKFIDASCTVDGSRTYVCNLCGAKGREETIPAKGHNLQVVSTVAAGCTEAGKTVYQCTVCGSQFEEAIPAKGHNYIYYKYFEAPDGAISGTHVKYCTICHHSKAEFCTNGSYGTCDVCGWTYNN